MKRLLTGLACATVLAVAPLAGASAADTPVLRVLVVQPTDLAAYVKEVGVLRGMFKKYNVPATLTIWEASYAGANAGAIVVGVQFPSMLAFAQGMETLRNNPEAAAEAAKVAGMRKVLSDSLYEELSH